MITSRSVTASLFAAVTLVGTAVPVAHALHTDPVPQPLVGPLAVETKYQDLDKLQDVVLGPMAIEPKQGDLQTYMKVTTAGGCPRGTNTVTRIYGPKLPKQGQNVIGNNYLYDFGAPPAPQMRTPLTITLQEVVERQPAPVTLNGQYDLRMQCQNADMDDFSVNFGVFEGKLRIRDGEYTALTTLRDLPEKPTPKTGPEAYAAWTEHQNAPPLPTPLPDQAALAAAERAAATSESGSDPAVALAVTGGVLAAGLIPILLFRRRGTTKTAK